MVERARWLVMAPRVGGRDAGFAAEHRDDPLVDVYLGHGAGPVGEQEVDLVGGLAIQHRRLPGPDGLPGLDRLP